MPQQPGDARGVVRASKHGRAISVGVGPGLKTPPTRGEQGARVRRHARVRKTPGPSSPQTPPRPAPAHRSPSPDYSAARRSATTLRPLGRGARGTTGEACGRFRTCTTIFGLWPLRHAWRWLPSRRVMKASRVGVRSRGSSCLGARTGERFSRESERRRRASPVKRPLRQPFPLKPPALAPNRSRLKTLGLPPSARVVPQRSPSFRKASFTPPSTRETLAVPKRGRGALGGVAWIRCAASRSCRDHLRLSCG